MTNDQGQRAFFTRRFPARKHSPGATYELRPGQGESGKVAHAFALVDSADEGPPWMVAELHGIDEPNPLIYFLWPEDVETIQQVLEVLRLYRAQRPDFVREDAEMR